MKDAPQRIKRPRLSGIVWRVAAGSLGGFLLMLAGATSVMSQAARGTVALARGIVEVQSPGQATWQPLATGASVAPGDMVRTGAGSAAEIRLGDGSLLRIGELTDLEVEGLALDAQGRPTSWRFDVARGRVRAWLTRGLVTNVSRETPRSFSITTPTTVSGVRQTDFIVTHNPRTTLYTLEGSVELTPKRPGSRSVLVFRNRTAFVEDGQDPTVPRPLSRSERASLLADLPFESASVPLPGGPTSAERVRDVLLHLVQITSIDRTAAAWILDGPDIRLQFPGEVTTGRPNPRTGPSPTTVKIQFN